MNEQDIKTVKLIHTICYGFKAHMYFLYAATLISSSIVIDQATKIMAEEHLLIWESPEDAHYYEGEKIPVLLLGEKNNAHKFFLEFNVNYVRNQGAAWGLFSEWPDAKRVPFFNIVALLAFIMLALYFRSTPPEHRTTRGALLIIGSGALGNVIDRLRLGYVIDFLDFRWNIPLGSFSWQYNFPNFNWADSMITIGVCVLLIDSFVSSHKV